MYDESFNPSAAGKNQSVPWAIEVIDPRHAEQRWRCLVASGATDSIAGHAGTWQCVKTDKSGSGEALDSLIVGNSPVFKVPFFDASQPELVEALVATVWD